MLGPYDYIVWFVCTLLEISVVVCAIKKGAVRRYLLLNVYMIVAVAVSIGRFQTLQHFGFNSEQYMYFYYYSDALQTILLYFALSSLYLHIFGELKAELYIRLGALLLLCGTAVFSYGVVQRSANDGVVLTQVVIELQQNLYFVGLVLTYILWAAVLKMRETRTRLIQLVLSMGVYFSLFAANFALQNIYQSRSSFFAALTPVFGCFLPLAWAYCFWKFSEEARLAPSRLAVIPR